MSQSRILLALAIIPFLSHAHDADAQSCDSSYLSRADTVLVRGVGAGRDTALGDSLHWVWERPDGPPDQARGAWSARLALSERRFQARVDSEFIYGLVLEAQDEYRISGLPDGTPVAFQVRLVGTDDWTRYTGCFSSGCTPTAAFTVSGTGAGEQLEHFRFAPATGPAPFDRAMTLTRNAGEPFLLRYRIWVGSSHDWSAAELAADVRFEGLPPGVTVIACTSAEAPTRARRTSWGALHARYREAGRPPAR